MGEGRITTSQEDYTGKSGVCPVVQEHQFTRQSTELQSSARHLCMNFSLIFFPLISIVEKKGPNKYKHLKRRIFLTLHNCHLEPDNILFGGLLDCALQNSQYCLWPLPTHYQWHNVFTIIMTIIIITNNDNNNK